MRTHMLGSTMPAMRITPQQPSVPTICAGDNWNFPFSCFSSNTCTCNQIMCYWMPVTLGFTNHLKSTAELTCDDEQQPQHQLAGCSGTVIEARV